MGLNGERLYKIWKGIKNRCFNSDSSAFKNYGGRGIIMCEEWRRDYTGFRDWATDSGYESTLTIERIDVNKGYSPKNCTWIPKSMQSRNRRNIVYVEGKTLTEISKRAGISRVEIKSRYYRGSRTIEELSKPLKKPILVNGKTLREISKETDIKYGTLKVRYRNGDRDYERLTRKEYERWD